MYEAQYSRITTLVDKTIQRLQREGYSADDARHLVSKVISAETTAVMSKGQSFDEKRFVEQLKQLPN